MERFDDITVESLPDHWEVSAIDTMNEDVPKIEVSYWELVGFIRGYYDMSRSEAINHLNRCEEHETENLLKELFKSKYK